MSAFTLTQSDCEMLRRLQSFLPDKIFDAHAHIYNLEHMPTNPKELYNRYGNAGAERFLADQKTVYADRKVRALFIPFPAAPFRDKALRHQVNAWITKELDAAPDCVCEIYTAPGDTAEELEAQLTDPRIKGFKCYHQTADFEDTTYLADIRNYLPESAWQMADKHHLCITLHMVKELSLSDPENMAYITEMTGKYTNAALILAHCARGFASWQTIEAVRQLKGIPNIYYDMAAVSDPATMHEVIRQAGVDHVMWGSDYPIDRMHGRTVNCGDSFTWLYNDAALEERGFVSNAVGLESLFAFYQASLMLDLTKADIENIFYNNAVRLFGLEG